MAEQKEFKWVACYASVRQGIKDNLGESLILENGDIALFSDVGKWVGKVDGITPYDGKLLGKMWVRKIGGTHRGVPITEKDLEELDKKGLLTTPHMKKKAVKPPPVPSK